MALKEVLEAAEAFQQFELKKKERAIVGELLMDFFEAERNLNRLLAVWICDPANADSLDTILVSTPLRAKITAAREYSLLGESDAKLFHKLCDDRNKLAHVPPKKKRIFDIFPKRQQELFMERCAGLNLTMQKRVKEIVDEWLK